ncbi:hypothetical protein [Streptomyces abikoensis]
MALLVGRALVVHGGIRRHEKDVRLRPAGLRHGDEEGLRGADGEGGAGQQGGRAEDVAGAGVGVGVGDDDAVDELGAGREDGGVPGRVDGLGEVAPAGQGGDAVLAQVLDGREDVGAGRQQAAVTEGAEDAGVVGGGRAQVEQLPLGGGDALVEQLAQRVGVAVELLGGQGPAAGCGAAARAAAARTAPG